MIMSIKAGSCAVLAAAACLIAVGSASPVNAESARQNVVQSHRYDRMLETNRGFRMARMRKECGPITDPQLRADCLASFSQNEPFVGSSTNRRTYGNGAGR
jgi:hypothetical protein